VSASGGTQLPRKARFETAVAVSPKKAIPMQAEDFEDF
jgi:hypothetical protein